MERWHQGWCPGLGGGCSGPCDMGIMVRRGLIIRGPNHWARGRGPPFSILSGSPRWHRKKRVINNHLSSLERKIPNEILLTSHLFILLVSESFYHIYFQSKYLCVCVYSQWQQINQNECFSSLILYSSPPSHSVIPHSYHPIFLCAWDVILP